MVPSAGLLRMEAGQSTYGSIPVHAVDRYESSKTQDSFQGGRVARTCTLICKDGQYRRFTASRPLLEEKALTDEFHYFSRRFYDWSFGSGPADEGSFAKVWSLFIYIN